MNALKLTLGKLTLGMLAAGLWPGGAFICAGSGTETVETMADRGAMCSLMLSLDGERDWRLAPDPKNVGRAEKWWETPRPDARPTQVPGIIQETIVRGRAAAPARRRCPGSSRKQSLAITGWRGFGANSRLRPTRIRTDAICSGSGRLTILRMSGSTGSWWEPTRAGRTRSCWT